jgi:hypothetical protein
MKWVWHVPRMNTNIQFQSEHLKQRDNMAGQGAEGNILLKGS